MECAGRMHLQGDAFAIRAVVEGRVMQNIRKVCSVYCFSRSRLYQQHLLIYWQCLATITYIYCLNLDSPIQCNKMNENNTDRPPKTDPTHNKLSTQFQNQIIGTERQAVPFESFFDQNTMKKNMDERPLQNQSKNESQNQFMIPLPRQIKIARKLKKSITEPAHQHGFQKQKDKKAFSNSKDPGFILPQLKPTFTKVDLKKKQKLSSLYSKKKQLHYKLADLTRQLHKIQRQLIKDFQEGEQPHSSTRQIQKKGARISKTNPVSRNISEGRSLNHSPDNDEQQSQLSKSTRAVQFIERVSKESHQRRNRKIQQFNNQLRDKLAHVCLECSRAKCQYEAMEGVMKMSRVK